MSAVVSCQTKLQIGLMLHLPMGPAAARMMTGVHAPSTQLPGWHCLTKSSVRPVNALLPILSDTLEYMTHTAVVSVDSNALVPMVRSIRGKQMEALYVT